MSASDPYIDRLYIPLEAICSNIHLRSTQFALHPSSGIISGTILDDLIIVLRRYREKKEALHAACS